MKKAPAKKTAKKRRRKSRIETTGKHNLAVEFFTDDKDIYWAEKHLVKAFQNGRSSYAEEFEERV